ncbi:hypothetical protein PG993_005172 [Apiospora rasikravindrae]|uniref:Uncharacterized protein n=1 Tax=Apiospora rasikravindrae TaxID=990691 RepID=A0ABR1TET9_9PEZI
MAGPATDFTLPSNSFFNIYTDGGRGPVSRASPAPAPAPSPALPGGQCNFVDLTHGANGPKCGCRRFWSRSALNPHPVGSPAGFPGYPNGLTMGAGADHTFWCMCSHHACFHDDVRESFSQGPAMAMTMVPSAVEQENERPRASREPLTPVIPDLSFPMPLSSGQPMDFHDFNNGSYAMNSKEEGQGSQTQAATVNNEPSMPDTLDWTNLIQSQPGDLANHMPPIPSQCVLQSQPSSTTSSVRLRYLQPFGGKGLHTLHGARSRLRETPLETVQDSPGPEDNAVEHSVAASNDDLPTVTNTPRSVHRTEERDVHLQSTGPRHGEFQELSSTVQGHGQRLDRLENVSFTENGHDECHEKHDQVDLRVTELELRVGELEKQLQDSSSIATSRYRHTGADDSTASVVSVSTNTSDRSHLYNELQALKAELSNLSSDPTYGNPWELEVVFLPFPLKGVWMEPGELMSQRLSGASHVDVDQWTQMPNSVSIHEPHSPGFNEWADPEMEFEWLLPRACPPDRMIDKRLQSRGLVKKVAVRGPDAHSVQQAISAAFGTSFRTVSRIQSNFYHGSNVHHRVGKFLGLQQPWVPLRKVHKDSRLRFLSPSEMITPAIWDVRFLKSSVVMKATGVHRLYITQPEAYIQDQDAYENGWNWQRLRELSRIYPDSQSSQQDVPEADALEDCWSFNDKLDESPSTQNSFSSLSLRQAAQPRLRSTSISPSPQHFFTSHNGQSPSLTTGRRSRAPSPFVALREQKSGSSLRPLNVRTTSMPPVLPGIMSPQQARRRMASVGLGSAQPYPNPYDRRSSPQVVRASVNAAHSMAFAQQKRRRGTRSPSVPMSARFRRTPRYSTASPSPGPAGFGAPGATSGRATTPFFYATPYSNAPYVDNRPNQGIMDEVDEDNRGSGTDSYAGGSGDDDDESDYEDDAQMLDLGHPRRRFNTDDETWQGAAQEPHQFPLPEDEPWPGIEDEDLENREPVLKAEHNVDIYEDEDAMSDIDSQMTVSQMTEHSERSVEEEHDDGGIVELANDHGADQRVANGDAEVASQHSSVPSEYPSTQRAWTDGAMEFQVYEDLANKKNT